MNELTQMSKEIKCACYCRKSTEQGLEQEFNSLDAQREACENYIASQKGNGWICLPEHYDDGGYSGGNMERPALKRLRADIEAGKVDIIVVYKIDRLTRSLMDFSDIQGFLDEHNVSFVSVTQEINTNTSAGRMMLNILMTFAQYEREIIAERVRDKIAGAKKKGKFCGGYLPLGYTPNPENKHLIVNPQEADIVRFIFAEYIRTGSAREVAYALVQRGFKGKVWRTHKGELHEQQNIDNQYIYRILRNPLYVGKVRHHDQVYPGEHEAIISDEVWNQAQNILKHNLTHHVARQSRKMLPFAGLVTCGACGGAMTLSHTVKAQKRQYRYYICNEDKKRAIPRCPTPRLPAEKFEEIILKQLEKMLQTPTMLAQIDAYFQNNGVEDAMRKKMLDGALGRLTRMWQVMTMPERYFLVHQLVQKIVVFEDHLHIEFKPEGVLTLLREAGIKLTNNYTASQGRACPGVDIPWCVRHGRKVAILLPGDEPQNFRNEILVKRLCQAHKYYRMLETGEVRSVLELAQALQMNRSAVARILSLVNLSPKIVEEIMCGTAPEDLSVNKLIYGFPVDWEEQERLFLGRSS